MRQCQCETPVIDWESPYCDGTCRRCAGDLGHTLVNPNEGGTMSAQNSEVERIERTDRLAATMLLQGDSRPATEVWDAAYEAVAHRMMLEAAADAEVARDEWGAS